MSFSAALLRRDDVVDITGNATAIAEACGTADEIDRMGLRIGAIFIILATSLIGTMFPVAARRVSFLRRNVPGIVFETVKYFGSGVILTTAFIHLLEPAADEELNGDNIYANGGCLPNKWGDYPWAFGICLISLFLIFVTEMFAYRLGSAHLAKIGMNMDGDAHHRNVDGHRHQHEVEGSPVVEEEKKMVRSDSSIDGDSQYRDSSENTPAGAQIVGVAILEFGVIFHSIIIGLTLALSTDEFNTLFIVIIFHQMFEGLGLGSRLAFLKLPSSLSWVPFTGALLYSICTPIGMAIGLGARSSISMSSTQASIASGVLDSISAGILMYTAMVELIAHEFIFNPYWQTASIGRLCYALTCFALGAGLMALLGKWA